MWWRTFWFLFLLIDVDRTGLDRSCPALCSGKHKYGFHAFGADPPHLRLRPVLEDTFFKDIHGVQKGKLPFPPGPKGPIPGSAAAQCQKSISDASAEDGVIDCVDAKGLSRKLRPPKQKELPTIMPRASVITDDQWQFEMDFSGQEVFLIDGMNTDNVGRVEEALSDLDRLAEEIAGAQITLAHSDKALSC